MRWTVSKPFTMGGGRCVCWQDLGLVNTISLDLDRLSLRLLHLGHCSICWRAIHHCLGLCRSAGPCDLYNGATYVLIFLANRHILWACDLYYGATYNPENMVVVVIVINNVVHIRCVPYRSYFNVTQFSLLHIFLNYI